MGWWVDKAKAENPCVSKPHRHWALCYSSRGEGKKFATMRVRNLVNSPTQSHGQTAGTGGEVSGLQFLGSFAFVSSSQSAFLLPPPLCSCNILLSRCWLPALSFCLYLCICIFFKWFFLCQLYGVCFSSSQFWSLHPMFFPPSLNSTSSLNLDI